MSIWVQEQRENLGSNHLDEKFLQTEQCLDEVTNVKIVILYHIKYYAIFKRGQGVDPGTV